VLKFLNFRYHGNNSGGLLGPGAQAPKSCPGPPNFNWFYSNFA